jgi:hypothetical protein
MKRANESAMTSSLVSGQAAMKLLEEIDSKTTRGAGEGLKSYSNRLERCNLLANRYLIKN